MCVDVLLGIGDILLNHLALEVAERLGADLGSVGPRRFCERRSIIAWTSSFMIPANKFSNKRVITCTSVNADGRSTAMPSSATKFFNRGTPKPGNPRLAVNFTKSESAVAVSTNATKPSGAKLASPANVRAYAGDMNFKPKPNQPSTQVMPSGSCLAPLAQHIEPVAPDDLERDMQADDAVVRRAAHQCSLGQLPVALDQERLALRQQGEPHAVKAPKPYSLTFVLKGPELACNNSALMSAGTTLKWVSANEIINSRSNV